MYGCVVVFDQLVIMNVCVYSCLVVGYYGCCLWCVCLFRVWYVCVIMLCMLHLVCIYVFVVCCCVLLCIIDVVVRSSAII